MNDLQIKNYDDFIKGLINAGFSMGGGNNEGIYSIVPWSWNEDPPYETPVRWHTGDPETDPWEWRMRVLDERNDIAYAKFFFKKSGFITKDWISYFLAVRRENKSFDEEYSDGLISNHAKRIYDTINENGTLPLHGIKQIGGFAKEEKPQFERALVELQTKMYITMCGRQQKISQKGEEYGWSSTVFCMTEDFWGSEIISKASEIEKDTAVEIITEQIYKLNPNANPKKILKFINS